MTELSSHKRLKEAYERGYHVTEDGVLHGFRKILKIKLCGKQKYPTFSTNWGGRVYSLPIHYLAAYSFYGDAVFDPNLVVRHMDGNVLNISKENIKLGTHSENNMDKPAHVRSRSASIARRTQLIRKKLNESNLPQSYG